MALVTSRELAVASIARMGDRLSPRNSRSITQPTAPRTFSELEEWTEFLPRAQALTEQLDNTNGIHPRPRSANLRPPASEASVVGFVENYLFEWANELAVQLGIPFAFVVGGSGRGLSFTDAMVVDTNQAPDDDNPSARVYAACEIKGPWQLKIQDGTSFIDGVRCGADQKHLLQVLQQLFGDLVTEEAPAGLITNYNETIFFKRANDPKCKKLWVSPVVRYNERPLQACLYVLHFVYESRGLKFLLPRNRVEVTLPSGYVSKPPGVTRVAICSGRTSTVRNPLILINGKSRSQKTPRFEQQADIIVEVDTEICTDLCGIEDLPKFSFADLGISSKCIGEGRHGKVLDGGIEGIRVAIKYYDLRNSSAKEAFENERHAYKLLKEEQGLSVPIVLCIGTLAHTNWPFIAMTNEGATVEELKEGLDVGILKKSITRIVSRIHRASVLHNDLRLSNILLCNREVRLIDFECAAECHEMSSFKSELAEVDDLVAEL